MADFASLIDSLVNPVEGGPGEGIYDDLTSTYNNDISVRDAKVESVGAELATAVAEIQRLKVVNYDLLEQLSAGSESSESEETSESVDEADNVSFDDLIE